MADELRSHPPTSRHLAQLWAQGITPASRVMTGALVVSAAALVTTLIWPWLMTGAQATVREGLVAATRLAGAQVGTGLSDAVSQARGAALRAWLVVGAFGAVLLVVALVVHRVQLAPRGDGSSEQGFGGRRPAHGGRIGVSDLGWAGLSALVALVGVLVAGRAAAAGGGTVLVSDPAAALSAAASLAGMVALPLLSALLGCALLDVLVCRAAFWAAALMSRRELQEELRLSEGPPLTRQRRRAKREGKDA